MTKKQKILNLFRDSPPKEGQFGYYREVARITQSNPDVVARYYGQYKKLLHLPDVFTTSRMKIEESAQPIEKELESRHIEKEKQGLEKKFEELTELYEEKTKELEEAFKIKNPVKPVAIASSGKRGSESTAFLIASDWHVEEEVKSESVNNLNEFNIKIADTRIKSFFSNSQKLLEMHKKEASIKEVVLCLLGDFFTGSIHEEFMETNEFPPGDAAWTVQNYLVSGIKFLLKETDFNFTLVCHSGNHGRMTKRIHIATETSNSLETYLYRNVANIFSGEKRLKFIVAESYHTYLPVYDFMVRIHHGHHLRFGGGIGGIFIPAYKAISQWNKGKRADLDIFGHFHQRKDGGNFISNGSLIGYNAFAISIKADYEEPQQTFFLINSKFGKTEVAPIMLK